MVHCISLSSAHVTLIDEASLYHGNLGGNGAIRYGGFTPHDGGASVYIYFTSVPGTSGYGTSYGWQPYITVTSVDQLSILVDVDTDVSGAPQAPNSVP